MTASDIKRRLINNSALFNDIYVIEQNFDIIPDEAHFGAAITYQDMVELRADFLGQLIDTIVDWVYSSEKYSSLKQKYVESGKSEAAASSEIIRKAKQKFRSSSDKLQIQGQLGELVLFNFIQHFMHAVPLLRKMPITTSAGHERYGADAIHYKVSEDKNIFILGEAKAYTSEHSFKAAMTNSISSILDSYHKLRTELNLYLHEDFLDDELDKVAELFLSNQLSNVQIELTCLIMYNEDAEIKITDENDIKAQIKRVIEERYSSYDKSNIDINSNPILKRITYIVFPIWKFDELASEFQKMF